MLMGRLLIINGSLYTISSDKIDELQSQNALHTLYLKQLYFSRKGRILGECMRQHQHCRMMWGNEPDYRRVKAK